jgi:hypothetical protein
LIYICNIYKLFKYIFSSYFILYIDYSGKVENSKSNINASDINKLDQYSHSSSTSYSNDNITSTSYIMPTNFADSDWDKVDTELTILLKGRIIKYDGNENILVNGIIESDWRICNECK